MTDTVKHMWDQVEKARADGTFSSEHAAVPAQCDAAYSIVMDALVSVGNQDAFLDMPRYTRELVDRAIEKLAGVAEQSGAGAPETSVRCGAPAATAKGVDEGQSRLPLQYEDGPDYCTVKDAQGRDFALTVQPKFLQAMERALADDIARLSRPPTQQPTGWPEPKVTNPDIANPTGVPYIDCLIHRVLDAQQNINLHANEEVSQSLCDAAALLDEVETALRTAASRTPAEVVHPDDFAQFLRDVEREQGNCSDEDTWLGYRQTAEAILEKFDVRPKHSSTVGGPDHG